MDSNILTRTYFIYDVVDCATLLFKNYFLFYFYKKKKTLKPILLLKIKILLKINNTTVSFPMSKTYVDSVSIDTWPRSRYKRPI